MFSNSKFPYLYFFFKCRYDWKHRGSAQIHGFIWLVDAQNMEKLGWGDAIALEHAKHYFENFVTTWNPRSIHL